MDFRYARLKTNIFVTMMYGAGLPILFPIAFISFLVTYLMEVYMLFYVYRVPPAYGMKLYKEQI